MSIPNFMGIHHTEVVTRHHLGTENQTCKQTSQNQQPSCYFVTRNYFSDVLQGNILSMCFLISHFIFKTTATYATNDHPLVIRRSSALVVRAGCQVEHRSVCVGPICLHYPTEFFCWCQCQHQCCLHRHQCQLQKHSGSLQSKFTLTQSEQDSPLETCSYNMQPRPQITP